MQITRGLFLLSDTSPERERRAQRDATPSLRRCLPTRPRHLRREQEQKTNGRPLPLLSFVVAAKPMMRDCSQEKKKGTPRAPAHPHLRTIFNTHPGGMPMSPATSLTLGARLSSSGLPDTCAAALAAANKNEAQRTSKDVVIGISGELERKTEQKKERTYTHELRDRSFGLATGIAKRERSAAIDTHGVAHKKAGSPTPGARLLHTTRNATACTIERKC
jgi:hypothetical protein